ncbi:MAG: murein hydrolase activator EnvC family protein [Lachnospiraceae bacterium]
MEQQETTVTGYQVSIVSHETEEKVKEFTITKKQIKALLITVAAFVALLIVWGVTMTLLFGTREKAVEAVNADLQEAQDYTAQLEQQVKELTEKNTLLSDTVNRKMEEEQVRLEEEAALFYPSGIPVNGTVLYDEGTNEEGQPYIEFTANTGAEVVAVGSGTVIMAQEHEDWGYMVQIDHGDGYVSTYQVREKPDVVVGDFVEKGDELFAVTRDNRTIIYQLLLDGEYINPEEIMEMYG